MSIGMIKQTVASVATPPSDENNFFVDSADGKYKKKKSDGSVVDLEAAASIPDAIDIPFTPSGDLTATNVQAMGEELDAEKAPITHVGAGGVSQHPVATGADAGFMSPSDKTKLDGVASGATANSSDAYLLSRANHTGTQAAATITGLAAVATSGSKNDVGLPNVDNTSDLNKPVSTAQAAADTAAIATAEAYSVQRANHTGTQLASTVSDFSSAADTRITAQKGAANGLATLDGSTKIPLSQLPAAVAGAVNYQGTWDASTNSPALASGVGTKGYYYIVNVAGSTSLDGTTDWKIKDWAIFNGATWDKVDNTDLVTSVNSYVGAVVLAKADIGLGNADNTSDVNKPVSTAQQTALNLKADLASPTFTGTVSGISKAMVGLPNVDNTSDANKPVSTAQATAIGLKVDKAGDTMTGQLIVPSVKHSAAAGTGFSEFNAQSSDPSTPTTGFKLFAESTGKFAWKGTNGFKRTFDGTANTADRAYILPDQNTTLMGNPMNTSGDTIYGGASGAPTRLPIGTTDAILRVAGGLPSWQPENLTQDFGDGSDGNLTVSGALTLTQIPYYDTLTIAAGALLNTAGFPIYCKTLDLTNAPAGSIFRNGNAGATVAANTGGAAGAALSAAVLGGSTAGSAGAAGQSNAGLASATPGGASPANGGAGGNSGASGAGGSGAAAAAGAGGTVTNYTHYGRFEYQFTRGATQILGGAGGDGGNSGGGDGANTSRGGGGGGGGAGVLVIYAANIITSVSTAAGVIQAKGGAGGLQTSAPAAGACGGAGGAGGGGGGFIYIAYVTKTGASVASLIDASGGNGGAGSNGSLTGIGGNGGNGGAGGVIQTYNVTTGLGVQVLGSAGGTGTAAVLTVGGAGGNGGSCLLSL